MAVQHGRGEMVRFSAPLRNEQANHSVTRLLLLQTFDSSSCFSDGDRGPCRTELAFSTSDCLWLHLVNLCQASKTYYMHRDLGKYFFLGDHQQCDIEQECPTSWL